MKVVAALASPSWKAFCCGVFLLVSSNPSMIVVQAQVQPNDRCSGAIPFVVGTNIVGNLTNATTDTADTPSSSCYVSQFDLGVWYSFTGTGGRVSVSAVEISTSGLEVNVYKGACGAETLQCQTQFEMDSRSGQSTIFTFPTEAGVPYRMLVFNAPYYDSARTFTLATASIPFLNDNDVCSRATPIVLNQTVQGNATLATSDELEVSDDCAGGKVDYRYPGVWHTFQGTGRKVTLLEYGSSYVSVYTGVCGSAATLKCVAGTVRSNAPLSFYSESGTTYYVLLRRRTPYSREYVLDLVEPDPVRDDKYKNDLCSKATPVSIGASFIGELFFSAFQIDRVPKCSDIGNGLWYSFQGSGGRVTATSRCYSESRFLSWVSSVSLYKGSCGASTLQCVARMSVNPCDAAPFTFNTEAGTTYYMLVQGFNADHGFNMTLLAAPLSIDDNDSCSKAKPVVAGVPAIGNNITLATTDEKDVAVECSLCDNSTLVSSRGLWFSLTGTGGRHWIDVCAGVNSTYGLNPSISVYKGTCGRTTQQCITGNTYSCYTGSLSKKVVFSAEAGTIYNILVNVPSSYYKEDTSLFDLEIKDYPARPTNDVCTGAAPVALGSTVTGSLEFATEDEYEASTACDNLGYGYGLPGPGLWYRFQGTGGNVKVVSNCNTSAFTETNIHVYKGTCGRFTLECVTGFFNLCYLGNNTFDFSTNTGTTYYMNVRTYYFNPKLPFEFSLESIPLAPVEKYNVTPVEIQRQCIAAPPGTPMMPTPTAPAGTPTSPTPAGTPTMPTPAGTPTVPTPAGTPTVPTSAGTPMELPPVGSPAGPTPAGTPTGPTPAGTPTVPSPAGNPVVPSSPATRPVAAPSTGRCRLGCRFRRFFKNIFGIFT